MTQALYAHMNNKKIHKLKKKITHTCNPSYSGDRDQKNPSSKPSQANSSRDPILKKKKKKNLKKPKRKRSFPRS
jgi:hypothetical protein